MPARFMPSRGHVWQVSESAPAKQTEAGGWGLFPRLRLDVQLAGPVEPGHLRRVTLAKSRILELDTELHLELAVGNLLVGQAALALWVLGLGGERGHPFAERFGEPPEKMDLGDRLVVHRVVDFAGSVRL